MTPEQWIMVVSGPSATIGAIGILLQGWAAAVRAKTNMAKIELATNGSMEAMVKSLASANEKIDRYHLDTREELVKSNERTFQLQMALTRLPCMLLKDQTESCPPEKEQ